MIPAQEEGIYVAQFVSALRNALVSHERKVYQFEPYSPPTLHRLTIRLHDTATPSPLPTSFEGVHPINASAWQRSAAGDTHSPSPATNCKVQ
jgi:hypothetical protein